MVKGPRVAFNGARLILFIGLAFLGAAACAPGSVQPLGGRGALAEFGGSGGAAASTFTMSDRRSGRSAQARGHAGAPVFGWFGRGKERMGTFTVSSASALVEAFAQAQSGDVIKLSPGNYHNVRLRNESFDRDVVITSADENNRAVLHNLTLQNVDDVTLDGVDVVVSGSEYYALRLTTVSNVVLKDLFVHGSLDGNPSNDQSGALVRDSSNVRIENSRFEELKNGFAALDSNGVDIIGNAFENLRSDGARASGTSNVTFEGNVFTNFFPIGNDHPDAIQLWTKNAKAAAKNIVIRDNIYFRGEGGQAQGIFMRDEDGDKPYENVLVENNTMLGGLWNAVNVSDARNVTVRDNTTASWDGYRGWVRVNDVQGGVVENNTTEEVLLEGNSGVSSRNNTIRNVDSGNDPFIQQQLEEAVASIGTFSEAAEALLSTFVNVPSGGGTPAPQPEPVPTLAPRDDTASVDEDRSVLIDVLGNDSGTGLRIVSVDTPRNGTVEIENNQIRYTPDRNYNGSESFDYTVEGNGGTRDEATVRVDIRAKNDKPDARGDAAAATAGETVLIDVLDNDIDIDGDILTIAEVRGAGHGTVVIEGTQIAYTPDTDFSGTDFFDYLVEDPSGRTDLSRVKVTVDGATLIDRPSVVDDPNEVPVVEPTPEPEPEPAPELPSYLPPLPNVPEVEGIDLRALIAERFALIYANLGYDTDFDIG